MQTIIAGKKESKENVIKSKLSNIEKSWAKTASTYNQKRNGVLFSNSVPF